MATQQSASDATLSDSAVCPLSDPGRAIGDYGPTGVAAAANTAPTAGFTYDPAEPSVGETVRFTADTESFDPDGEIDEYSWRVDGRKLSNYPSFQYSFDGPGEYEVRLTVTDDDGATDTMTKTVTVRGTGENQLPTADFSVTPQQPKPGEEATFLADASDPDGEVVAYAWQIDGQRISGGSEFAVYLPEAREYDVRLTVTDDDGAVAATSETISVTDSSSNQPPTVAISTAPTEVTPGEAITLTAEASDPDGEITGYTWRVDGTRVGEGPSLQYAVDEPGEYAVEVVAVDDEGARTTASRTVTAEETESPTPTPTESPTPTPTESPTPTPTESPTPPDNVRVTAEWWHTPLTPTAGAAVTLVAAGESGKVSYQWDIDGDGEAEKSGRTMSHVFAEPGARTVTLRAVGPDGKTETQSATVQVTAASVGGGSNSDGASFWMSPRNPLPGETVTLIASGAGGPETTYRWEVGDTEKRGQMVSYTLAGGATTITLSRIGAEGEVTTQSRSVATRDASNVTRSGDGGPSLWMTPLSPRPGEAVTLVAEPGATPDSEVADYRWDLDGDGDPDARGRTVRHNFSSDRQTTVTLVVERTNGTTATVEETVAVGNATAKPSEPTPEPEEDPTDTASPETDDTSPTETPGGAGPGFGPVVTVVALLLVLSRRRWT
ncbi:MULTISPECIES: PKD domain-containing protein [Salinibaculum]|uniref:PKD domain-containing protein n=1 Tax=Salinibaculum TaxID=2732368 RepID=UPI0030D4D9A2